MSRREPPEPRSEVPTPSWRPPLAQPAPPLTKRQRQLVGHSLERIRSADHWHGGLPVLLLERCWLRLSVVVVEELATRLPPDCSREAPELVRYRELLATGLTTLEAEQLCWQDFGMEACRQAQHRFWQGQERGNNGWTLERYLDLLQQYRLRVQLGSVKPLPLLVLARQGEAPSHARHSLIWLGPDNG